MVGVRKVVSGCEKILMNEIAKKLGVLMWLSQGLKNNTWKMHILSLWTLFTKVFDISKLKVIIISIDYKDDLYCNKYWVSFGITQYFPRGENRHRHADWVIWKNFVVNFCFSAIDNRRRQGKWPDVPMQWWIAQSEPSSYRRCSINRSGYRLKELCKKRTNAKLINTRSRVMNKEYTVRKRMIFYFICTKLEAGDTYWWLSLELWGLRDSVLDYLSDSFCISVKPMGFNFKLYPKSLKFNPPDKPQKINQPTN